MAVYLAAWWDACLVVQRVAVLAVRMDLHWVVASAARTVVAMALLTAVEMVLRSVAQLVVRLAASMADGRVVWKAVHLVVYWVATME